LSKKKEREPFGEKVEVKERKLGTDTSIL